MTQIKPVALITNIIIPQNDILRFDAICKRWNLPEDNVATILFKLRPAAYSILTERYNKTYGYHYICAEVDYEDDLLDYNDHSRDPIMNTIREQVVFQLKDIIAIEMSNKGLFCNTDAQTKLPAQSNTHTKTVEKRIEEFSNCTYEEIDIILNKYSKLSKGQRHCLHAARAYLFGISPMEAVYSSVIENAFIKDPASQARRWLREAKNLLPSIRNKA